MNDPGNSHLRYFSKSSRRRGARALLVVVAAVLIALLVGTRAPRSSGDESPNVVPNTRATAVRLADGAAQSGSVTSGAAPSTADPEWFIDRAAPPLTLAGRVFAGGVPGAGVTVVLNEYVARDNPDKVSRRLITDAAGRFSFEGVPGRRGDSYRIEAYSTDASPAAVNVPGDQSKRDIELRLEACKLHLYGTVRDASGGAVAGARVFVQMTPESSVLTSATGEFRLCTGPLSGVLRIEAAGYGAWTSHLTPRGTTRQDVTLSPGGQVAGEVVMRETREPVPFARVSLRSEASIGYRIADEHGAFRFEAVSPGTYAIEARGPHSSSKAPVDVGVFAGGTSQVTVPLEPRATVRGHVETAEGPIANVVVSMGFNATFEWSPTTHSAADGAFALNNVPRGGRLMVKVDDYEIESPRTLDVPDAGLDDIRIRVRSRAGLTVTVTRRGEPVRAASVSLRGGAAVAHPTNGSTTLATDVAGRAVFAGLADGVYRVIAEHESGFVVKDNVQLARTSPSALALDLADGKTIHGQVLDPRGAPVDGAIVAFTRVSSTEDGAAWGVSGSDGAFRGGPLRGPATYRVAVSRSRMNLAIQGPAPRVVVNESGDVEPKMLKLVVETQAHEVRGRVIDDAGGPVRDARVVAKSAERHGGDVYATTTTGNDGEFVLRGLATGPYAIRATAANGSEVEKQPVTLPTADMVLALPVSATLRGTLRGFRRTPSVMAWGVAGYDWDFHPAVLDGDRYEVRGLSVGRYHIAASTNEAAASATIEVTAAGAVADLVASNTRTVHGAALDFVTGHPMPGVSCQAAPYVEGARSPVVVPGLTISDAAGAVSFTDVPAAPLYSWCWNDRDRGGSAKIPADLGERVVKLWLVDTQGIQFDTKALGMTYDDDEPFSHRIVRVDPRGAAERAGIQVGDLIVAVGGRSVEEGGNGLGRNYLAFVLAQTKQTTVTVLRNGTPVTIDFSAQSR